MSMTPEDFAYYKKFLYEKSGLALSDEKTYLLESRLNPVAKKNGLPDLDALTKSLRLIPNPRLEKQVIDAMTTNETLFFRDDRPFKQFRETVLPAMIKVRESKKSLRIWSAACSTGQEPYSIALTLHQTLPNIKDWRIEILGTDLSDDALAQARKAEYNQFEVQRGMPIQMLMKYFAQENTGWKLQSHIRDMVRYESFNLLEKMDRFPTFDIIFCRNVLIYFDEQTKKKVLAGLVKKMAPDGFLFLGGAETAIGLCPELKVYPACPGLYAFQPPTPESAPKTFAPAPGATLRAAGTT